jgi:glycosyltransferase involved in cell wall biosynthesis
MRTDLARPPAGDGTVVTRAIAGLRAADAMGLDPVILGYYPVYTTNPYLGLLYQRAWDVGIVPVPVPSDERIPELVSLARLGHRVVLHMHWLNRPLLPATSPADAVRLGRSFLALLDEARAAGVRVAWTVHNLLPHGTRFHEEEAAFRGEVAKRVDVIHVMASATRELVAPYFDLPADRLLHVPHPSYAGAYPDYVTRAQARFELGIAPDELVYLALGSIRAYKGLERLLDAWDALPDDGTPRRLVIAGAPGKDEGIAETLSRAALHPTVLLHAQLIEDERMQVFLRAADIAVLPYLRSLNSGALVLALTFGLPAIVPAGYGFGELLDDVTGRTFDPDSTASLAEALVSARAMATPEASAAAAAVAARFDSAELSLRFATSLRERLGWPVVEPGARADTVP